MIKMCKTFQGLGNIYVNKKQIYADFIFKIRMD